MKRIATEKVIAAMFVMVGASCAWAQQIYWAELAPNASGRITRANLDGTGAVEVVNTGSHQPAGIALDSSAGKIYWTDGFAPGGAGGIHRAKLDGSNQEDILPDAGLSSGIAIDHAQSKLYWTRPDGLYRSNLDGTDVEPYIAPLTASHVPYGVAIDPVDNVIYWTEASSGRDANGVIRRQELDGLNGGVVYDVDDTAPVAIALDVIGGKMYWVDTTMRALVRANLDGSSFQFLFGPVGAEFPAGVGVDTVNGKVYWSLPDLLDGIGRIRQSNLDGTSPQNYQSMVVDPKGLAISTAPLIASSNPPNCAIDAREPHLINDAGTTFGWNAVDILFTNALAEELGPDDFSVTEFGGDGTPVSIASVDSIGPGEVRVHFITGIEPGAWTCVTHIASTTKTCIGYLPGDVNADGSATPVDILRLIDDLNGVVQPPFAIWQGDVNRSGIIEPSDVLRVIDLLNGADAFTVWLNTMLPACPSS